MKKSYYKVLGVMSGTSLDGIDLALIHLDHRKGWGFQIEVAETVGYSEKMKGMLAAAIDFEPADLHAFNIAYTEYLAKIIGNFISKNNITNLDAICSHGHTIKHEPQNGFTLQIGNLEMLSQILKNTVVCDYRVQDVELGGQGAPLVPVGDRLLFPGYKYCLNLGGFANISTEGDGRRIAFDICAVNTVLNYYAQKLGMEYDRDGNLAATGKLNASLLQELDALEFYSKSAPKSLGIEWVNSHVLPILHKYDDDIPGILNTFSKHIAKQIASCLDNDPASEMLVTGGGCFNSYLMKCLGEATKVQVVIPSAEIINYKEALIFGLLGVLRLREEINVLSSVTGACRDHSSGRVFVP
ncbi:anhydro-N-acetylmuramic acid kinase [Antarcticibacterium flavum]|uniref:Anhydro-N-acetylmuramic acid kinase n=1 Tax=Antarcticibacterium flavum TaxID=2058175 RepID=A0A5B7X1P5_9FLAO|nr:MULTISPECIES: anhydro-N-acetylmuramic acid kinase [Antarcticibacterium]MCM4161808.1 anhydro-N-acetylmuramic acid kinase [Antarcticibacterium sp. W02-3]QCY69239.1 anhydro-N-acetylmuramic acid kinase [Antarcticibacterium flavum]